MRKPCGAAAMLLYLLIAGLLCAGVAWGQSQEDASKSLSVKKKPGSELNTPAKAPETDRECPVQEIIEKPLREQEQQPEKPNLPHGKGKKFKNDDQSSENRREGLDWRSPS